MIALPASPLKRAGLAFTFLWFFVGGIGHFVIPGFFASICPPWVPDPLRVVYLSGAVEIALALQLIPRRTRSFAGYALLALILAVTPVHIWMLMVPERLSAVPGGRALAPAGDPGRVLRQCRVEHPARCRRSANIAVDIKPAAAVANEAARLMQPHGAAATDLVAGDELDNRGVLAGLAMVADGQPQPFRGRFGIEIEGIRPVRGCQVSRK